jgi:hypothetical protein
MLDEDGDVVLFEQQAAEGEFECCYFGAAILQLVSIASCVAHAN